MHLLTQATLPTNVIRRKYNQASGPYCLRLIIWASRVSEKFSKSCVVLNTEALLILEQVGEYFCFHLAQLIHQIVLEEFIPSLKHAPAVEHGGSELPLSFSCIESQFRMQSICAIMHCRDVAQRVVRNVADAHFVQDLIPVGVGLAAFPH